MNLDQYERRFRIHEVFAGSLAGHLSRLWGRPLTDTELAEVGSSTICCTFMRLELLEGRLASASTPAVADEVFASMTAEVLRSRSEVIRAMSAFANNAGVSVDNLDSSDLLTFELALLERFKRSASNA